MKGSIITISTIAALSVLFVTSTATANTDPNVIEIGLSCPDTSGAGVNTLSNFGNQISGYGKESINSTASPHTPYFTYKYFTGHYPAQIVDGMYANSGVQFDPTQSVVSCEYTSSAGFDPIRVNYMLTNGYGGVIISQNNDTIVINQYIGFKKSA